jgi:lysozyme family protein
MQKTFTAHAMPFVLAAEGGYSNDPNDAGGATCMGIEQGEYNAHRSACGEPAQSVRFITIAEATNIYHDHYWAPIQGDDLPYPIDWVTFDCAVNCGVQTAINLLERAVSLPSGRAISPALLAKAKAACSTLPGTHNVKTAELSERSNLYRTIVANHPEDAKFLSGWLGRDVRLAAVS